MRIIKDLTAKTGLRLELRLPDEGPFALFIYFHGGGLQNGGISSCHYFSETLCKRGIGVMLDGVFNHTGDDSRYFNAKGRYETVGAAQSVRSPYYPWYYFKN